MMATVLNRVPVQETRCQSRRFLAKAGVSPRRASVGEEERPRCAPGYLIEHAIEARFALGLIPEPPDLKVAVVGVHDLRLGNVKALFLVNLRDAAALLRRHA